MRELFLIGIVFIFALGMAIYAIVNNSKIYFPFGRRKFFEVFLCVSAPFIFMILVDINDLFRLIELGAVKKK